MRALQSLDTWWRYYRQGEVKASPPKEIFFQLIRDLPISSVIFGIIPHVLRGRTMGREEMRQQATEYGQIEYFGEREEISISHQGSEIRPRIHSETVGEYELPQPFVCTWSDSILCGHYPIAFTQSGEILQEAIGKPRILPLNIVGSATEAPWHTINTLLPQLYDPGVTPGKSIKSAMILFNKWSDGYAHWIRDDLTRIQGLREYERRTGEEPSIIFSPEPTPFQTEMMEILGFDDCRIYHWDGRPTHIEKLVISSPRRYKIQSRDAIQWLRKAVVSGINIDEDRFSDYIYISRKDARRRHVVNEDEVLESLGQWGFKRVIPTEHSLPEQIAIFNQADIIVGPHGANLVNTIFADNSILVEIFGSHTHAVQLVTCNLVDCEYRALQAECVGIDMRVDIGELKDIIQQIIEGN